MNVYKVSSGPVGKGCPYGSSWSKLEVMKLKLGFVASLLGLMIAFVGCANQDDGIIPAKRPGFRPPSTPLVQDELPPIDPLGVPAGNDQPDVSPNQGNSSAVVNSNPIRPPVSQQPAALPDPVPQPAPQLPPQPAPQPKAATPEYAKRVPGKPNWIRSPYDGKILDATGFPPGTEVRDPQTGKIMLVP